MNRRFFLIGILIIGGVLAACSTTHSELPPKFQTDYMLPHGKQIYLEFCAECHQVDGSGWSTLYPRLDGNPIVTLADPSPLIETVVYGQGSMSAFGQKLNSEDIASVLTYIRSAWHNHAPPVSPRQIQ